MKRYALPLLIISSIMGALHFLVFWVTTFSLPAEHPANLAFFVLLCLGWIFMPVGMIISQSSYKKKLAGLVLADYYYMGFFLILWFFSLIELVAILLGYHEHSYWILPAATGVSLWAVRNGKQFPKTVTHEISGPAVMRGLSLVQISDLHVGMPGLGIDWLSKVVETINDLKPHMIAITGDLVDDKFSDVSPLLEPLSKLQASKEKFYITGNHEYIRGGNWEQRLAELGFTVLHNSHKVMTLKHGALLVAGVPDKMVESDPDKALKTSTMVNYRILLAHQPNSVFQIKTEKCDLLLAGHTHGGQIFPFAIFVRMVQPVVAGFKLIQGILVFAHVGTGRWGPPMRWLTRSEIVQIKWI